MRLGPSCATTLLVLGALTFPVAACSSPTQTPEVAKTPPVSTATADPPSTFPSGQVRQAAVAGSWYPDNPVELTAMVDDMLRTAVPVDGVPIGLVVPHAGYVFSGLVAAHGFRQLEEVRYDVVVIVASDHQTPVSSPISVWAEGGFETPLGVVPVEVETAQALVAADPRISSDYISHKDEHPIEIQLPFLQRVCPTCSIVPVLMGDNDDETVQALSRSLVQVLTGRRAVVIASSDLSHYPTYDDALIVDGATLGAIETGNPVQVRDTTSQMMRAGIANLATCACGEGPILVAMEVSQSLGANTISVLRYANSGDSPNGSRDQVVGYSAVMFWQYEEPDLTQQQQEELLALARAALDEYLEHGTIPEYKLDGSVLHRRSGVFVTLRKAGQLRGCIGHTGADLSLYEAAQQMAIAAATQDPRFPPLAWDELASVEIEISILSPLRRLMDVEKVEVGTHGLMIFKKGRQGLLLPQVAAEEGWGRGEFLDNLCLKAGLPATCWQESARLYAFTAVVLGE